MTCVRHPEKNGPAWCMDCYPERYERYAKIEQPTTPVPQQESLWGAAKAEEEAEKGMQKARDADRVQEWKAEATAWITNAPSGYEFTADDVVRKCGLPDEGVNKNNVIGAVFSALSKKGVIVWTGRFAKSERVVRHGNIQRVWRRV